ncbi:MAG TPA: hypothetical protein PK079_23360 [Leptospiraceae bacterium]|nr:hypothetical protein [Leptospiraceae bacterium]HMW06535.1 hypothetical protein [Leptospiraceae bacterium]HMX35289.1 hypothetical protein [Leptospiraceae bacterium]HMY32827.1 hypothetical protein [Leptospiraceae bacterium]HMZ65322.1 hypothetical protein [Leptospiraceae bacterium]
MNTNQTEIVDLESTKILKKLSAVLEDEKNHQIEELSFIIRMNRKEMAEIREKYGLTRTEFFKIPDPDGIHYFKLRTQNFLMESTIKTITMFTRKLRGQK